MIDYVVLLQQGAGAQGGGMFNMVIMLAVMFGVFYFIVLRPQSKEQKRHQQFLGAMKVGDDVVTSSGIFGRITKLDDKTVTLEISRGTTMKVLRQQIQGSKETVLSADTAKETAKSESSKEETKAGEQDEELAEKHTA